MKKTIVAAAICLTSLMAAAPAGAAPKTTVTMSGNAYAFLFSGYDDKLQGATIGIAGFPGLKTTAGPDGAYSMRIPNRTPVTPYATMPGYHKIFLQTFYPRGYNLTQVNFQMPADSIYTAFANLVGADIDPVTNNPVQCAIVTTASQLKARNFPTFDDFWNYHPHGVPGTTATGSTEDGLSLPPTLYFNDAVIPDPAQTSTTTDGGALWKNVPTGVYTVKGRNLNYRFGQFQADCKPGRLINANPPWGLYQLAGDEESNPATLPQKKVDARITSAKIVRKSGKRILRVRISATEGVKVTTHLSQPRGVETSIDLSYRSGNILVTDRISKRLQPGKAKLQIILRDMSGNVSKSHVKLYVPRTSAQR